MKKKLHQANLIVHAQLGHTLQIPYDAYFIKKGRKSIKTWIPMNDIITFKKTIFELLFSLDRVS